MMPAAPAPAHKARMSNGDEDRTLRYAWYVALVLMACNTLSFVDRQILGLLVTPIKRDLGLSDTEIGLLQGLAFGIFYTLLGLPMGRLVDHGSRRALVAAGVFGWSLATSLCAGARSFTALFLARMGVGVGEATLSPSAFSLLSDYFPRARLASALSVFSMGIFFGSGLALILGGLVIGAVGSWRTTFLIVGAPGLLMALVALSIHEPDRRHLLRTESGEAVRLGFGAVLREAGKRGASVAGICFAFAAQALCNYAQQAWLPTYFVRLHGWSLRQAGVSLGTISLATGLAGSLLGGWLADRWQRQGVPEAPLRVGVLATSCAGMTFTLALAAPSLGLQLALLGPAFLFLAMPIGSVYASLQLILPNQVRGQIGALQLFTLNLFGLILGPALPGLLDDYVFRDGQRIGWSLAITVGSASLVSALLFLATFRPYRRDYALMHAAR
jgi:MFS family permease